MTQNFIKKLKKIPIPASDVNQHNVPVKQKKQVDTGLFVVL